MWIFLGITLTLFALLVWAIFSIDVEYLPDVAMDDDDDEAIALLCLV